MLLLLPLSPQPLRLVVVVVVVVVSPLPPWAVQDAVQPHPFRWRITASPLGSSRQV